MPVRRSLIIYGLLFLIAPVGVIALLAGNPQGGGDGSGGGGGRGAPAYEYQVVGRGDVVSVVSAVGEIEADEIVDVSFTLPGKVAEVFAQPGDYVEEGDLLMRLENDVQRIAYDRAMLNLETREIELDDLEGPVDARDIRIAEANVDAAYGNYQSASQTASAAEIAAADLQVEQAQAAYDAAVERRQTGGEFELQEEVDLADAQIGEASFNLQIARLNAQDLRTGDGAAAYAAFLAYEQSLAELDRVLAGPDPILIEQAQVRVEQAMAAMEQAEASLRKTEVRAPFTGYVTDVYFEPGALVGSGTIVLQMLDVDPLSVTVQVDEIDIGQIDPGMDVRVEVDALPDQFLDARLEKIALTGRQTQGGIVNYEAEVLLDEVVPGVRVGMTAEANIIVNQASNVIAIPNAYIRLDRSTGQAFTNIVDDQNDVVEIPISIGLRGEDFSEVIAGLSEGDIIAADLSGNQLSFFGG